MATDAERHLANWQDEIDSVALYHALADLESDPRLADVYRRLGARAGATSWLHNSACQNANTPMNGAPWP